MNQRLRYLPLPEVAEGMVLGAPVVLTASGGVMSFNLPVGHELTESNLRQLAVRQAEVLCIVVPDHRTEAEQQAEQMEAAARLTHIFRLADRSQPVMEALYQAVLAYRNG